MAGVPKASRNRRESRTVVAGAAGRMGISDGGGISTDPNHRRYVRRKLLPASGTLPQPLQHFETTITVGRRDPDLGLEILDRLHGVVADASVGAAGIEAGLGEPRLHLLHFGQRQRTL